MSRGNYHTDQRKSIEKYLLLSRSSIDLERVSRMLRITLVPSCNDLKMADLGHQDEMPRSLGRGYGCGRQRIVRFAVVRFTNVPSVHLYGNFR